MHTHLPADICNASSALPALITYASQGNHQASAAITALQNLHQVLQNRPASCSLFLDTIIQNGGKPRPFNKSEPNISTNKHSLGL